MACPDTQIIRGVVAAESLISEKNAADPFLHSEQDIDSALFEKMAGPTTTTFPRSHPHSSQRSSGSSSRFTGSKGSIGSTTLTGSGVSIPEVKRRPSVSFGITPDPDLSSAEETWISDLHQRFGLQQPLDQQNDSTAAILTPPKPRFARTSKTKNTQFRPIRRTSDDGHPPPIEIPRSVAMPEGLGIRTDVQQDTEDGDSITSIPIRRSTSGFHHRSVSGASQFSSTTSSTTRSASQHVHPMRKTPSCYTPPLGQSFQNYNGESEPSADTDESSSDTIFPRHSSLDLIRESVTSTGTSFHRPKLTRDSSLPRFSESSQTTFIGRRSFGHNRDSTGALEPISPISRSSLDFGFRKTRTSTDPDPISRAATVQAARQAFEEKEAAKNRKYEKQQLKAQEKEQRRKQKQLWQRYRDVDVDNLEDATGPEEPVSEKTSEDEGPASNASLRDPSGEQGRPGMAASLTGKSRSHPWKTKTRNTWVLFLTWLRTRVFKVTRKLRRSR
ncbi:hypothetical protein DTO164E3_5637 [Paecilomyces variotii]|nr:hypothetical protein DTO032I3_7420 [Paecilomyces variotii]KAJ9197495.1 hypothetical protein DTO164E3_5637 [Paecilomyces variotii]KAJ9221158.1 hypothetical protein DTO169C6_6544 [Paecilomyces variotii]KAJ9265410.1 hypothetical protein DTO195F2_1756 [Paecilomyces variotii]KAJ9278039.1 hypothetical protein DTO021D3_5006 [Paecilomyces variotii]